MWAHIWEPGRRVIHLFIYFKFYEFYYDNLASPLIRVQSSRNTHAAVELRRYVYACSGELSQLSVDTQSSREDLFTLLLYAHPPRDRMPPPLPPSGVRERLLGDAHVLTRSDGTVACYGTTERALLFCVYSVRLLKRCECVFCSCCAR